MAWAGIASYTGTGASKTTVNIGGTDYDVYEFPNGGTVTFGTAGDIEVLVQAAGGSAGCDKWSAGGGAGRHCVGTIAVTATTETITRGLGGADQANYDPGVPGGDSSIGSLVVAPGGGPGWNRLNTTHSNVHGGSGGGGGGHKDYTVDGGLAQAGTGITGLGNNGGDRNGGGGGAGTAGGAGFWDGITIYPTVGGDAGEGVQSNFNGTLTWYAAGGYGYANGVKGAAATGTGSLGSGGNANGLNVTTDGGKDGIVMIRVPTPGAGGTTYTQSISASKSVSSTVNADATFHQSVAATRTINGGLDVVAVLSAAILVTKAMGATLSTAAVLGHTITATRASASSLARKTSKFFARTKGVDATLTRKTSKNLSAALSKSDTGTQGTTSAQSITAQKAKTASGAQSFQAGSGGSIVVRWFKMALRIGL